MTFYEIIMKIIKNCVVISFLLVIMAGCGAKVTPSSGATSNPSNSNSGSGGPVVPPPTTDPATLIHMAVENQKVEAFKSLIKKDPNLLKKTDKYGKSPLFKAVSSNRESIIKAFLDSDLSDEEKKELVEAKDSSGETLVNIALFEGKDTIFKAIMDKFPDSINAKNLNGLTALHIAAAIDPSKIALLAQNPHLDVNVFSDERKDKDGNILNRQKSVLSTAISYAPSYQYELELTAEQKTKPSNNKFINFMRLQDQDNTQNRDEAVDALLQINNLSEKTITDGAIMAAGNADTINLKKLLDTKKVKLDEEIKFSKDINANRLVWSCLYFVFVDLTEINKLNNISDKNGKRWDADVYYKTQITKAVIDNLQALKDAGLPKEAFSNNILNIQWADLVQSEMLGMFTWHFKEVQDKLKELAK